ncbi:MAG TPA: GDSL-type esterase/lipase family protein, partial [Bacillota bacterium]|nr:GDSL-type esterase/lipase family protein [Bacillota bacterium]
AASSGESEAESETSQISDTSAEESDDGTFLYVALGDSIPYGYGLTDHETQCYPYLFYQQIGSELSSFSNAAISGQTSPQLAAMIEGGAYISNADLITVTIGANNILGSFFTDTLAIVIANGGGVITSLDGLIGELAAYSSDTTSETTKATLKKIIDALNTYYSGKAFEAKMDAAAAQLNTDITSIIASINTYAPAAEVIFTTIYSPYKGCSFGIEDSYVEMTGLSDLCVEKLNTVIRERANEEGYTVAEVYTAFEESDEDLVNANISMTDAESVNVDPHPNSKGAQVIADTLADAISKG